MAQPAFNGTAGCHQRLAQHLAAKHMGKAEIFTVTLKMVISDGRQIQQINQLSSYFQHADSCCYKLEPAASSLAYEIVSTSGETISQRSVTVNGWHFPGQRLLFHRKPAGHRKTEHFARCRQEAGFHV